MPVNRKFLFSALVASTALIGAGVALGQGAPMKDMPMKDMPMKEMPMAMSKGSLKVLSPAEGAKVTTTDIPVRISVANFKLSPHHIGLPNVEGEGHVHVMLDGMNMGVLFNAYASTHFTLPGRSIAAGEHTLIFDLASNTHGDFGNTVQKVKIDYQPAKAVTAPSAAAEAGMPALAVSAPADGATVGPKFTLQVKPANFQPALDLEGKPNVKGYGHYHVFVDMDMASMSGGMMSMAGMVGMPGSNSIPLDLSSWKNGKHTITVMEVQNDHTPIMGAKPAMVMINLTGAGQK
ncbi:MAG: hypothetical protein HY269_05605 [Deltaproteobacteria bacterium]|nr:hypothetical protein [Deltaproteobacteria bacterium]